MTRIISQQLFLTHTLQQNNIKSPLVYTVRNDETESKETKNVMKKQLVKKFKKVIWKKKNFLNKLSFWKF